MKKCPFCAEVQDEAIVCKHCGRDLKAPAATATPAATAQVPPTKKKTGCFTWVVLGLFVLLAITMLQSLFSHPSPSPNPAPTAASAPAAAKPVDKVASDTDTVKHIEKRIAANKEHLKKYYANTQQVRQAVTDQAFLQNAKSSYARGTTPEATSLSQSAARLLPQVEQQLRELYASSVEEIFVKSGMDAKVSVIGPTKTRLRVTYALMSQPLIYRFQNDMKLDEQARQFGFTRLEYTNGFESDLGKTWTVDLTK